MKELFAVAALAALASGCFGPGLKISNPEVPEQKELLATPFFPQTDYHCGPAALATLMGAEGTSITPERLAEKLFIPELEGSLQVEMLAASRQQGFIPVRLDTTIDTLIDTIATEKPVLVLQNLATPGKPHWHYAVLIGYDAGNNRLVLRSGTEYRKQMRLRAFSRTWNWAGNWAFVLLKPGEMVSTISQEHYFQALIDIEQTANQELSQAAYSGALMHWPESEFIWTGIGTINFKMGQLSKAEVAFRTLLDFHPDSVAGRNNLASILLERGCNDLAIEQIEIAKEQLADDERFTDVVESTRQEISASIAANGLSRCAQQRNDTAHGG